MKPCAINYADADNLNGDVKLTEIQVSLALVRMTVEQEEKKMGQDGEVLAKDLYSRNSLRY